MTDPYVPGLTTYDRNPEIIIPGPLTDPAIEIVVPAVSAPAIKLDLGCGKVKREGWIGVDVRQFEGVDVVCDLGKDVWPFADDSVEEAQASHVVEHFKPEERIHFVNELCRVLKKAARCQIVTPHWGSTRAYGDLTHQWPPVCEMWYFYLSKDWRSKEAPHCDMYTCDFDATWGYGINPKIQVKSREFQEFALEFYREAAMDLVATIVKR